MVSRLFVTADHRMAVGWRIFAAVIAWFAMLIVTEELIANAAGPAVGGIAVIGGSIVLAVFLRRRVDRRRDDGVRGTLAGLGLPGRGAAGGLFGGFALGAAAMGVVLVVSVATHAVHLKGWNPHHAGIASAAWLLAGELIFFLGVGFTEELLFRGYILQNLGESMPLWGALVLSSVLFGLFHGLHARALDLVEIAIGGLMLGLLRLVTGTLWLAIGFHAAWDFIENGIVTTRLLPAKGPMLEQTVSGWLIPVLVTAVAVLILTRRSGARLSWRQRISESGKLPLVTVEG